MRGKKPPAPQRKNPIDSVPTLPCNDRCVISTARSAAISVFRASARKISPCGVMRVRRVLRSSSGPPISASMSAICSLIVDWETWRIRLASLKLPESATAQKYLRCRSSIYLSRRTYRFFL